tara:strand:+ start:276 stop:503 length:228 start_codon:yes stop_codon:yes gene_type:complete
MKYKVGDAVKLIHEVLVQGGDPSQDLHAGMVGVVIEEEKMIFDPDDPENTTETVYLCLVNGIHHHLFASDIVPVS